MKKNLTSPAYKMKYSGVPALLKTLVGDQNKLPENLKKAIEAAPGKKTTDPKKKDDFRYESDAPEVIGTAYTKGGTERVAEYKKGGKELKKGDTYDYGGFQTPKKVVDTGRDASGKKKSGRTGTVDVEVKKGDIRFSTGKKTKEKKGGSGKSPAKMQDGKKGRPGTGVRKEPRPLTPSQKANIDAQNKKANANAKMTGRGTGLIKDPTMRTKNKK